MKNLPKFDETSDETLSLLTFRVGGQQYGVPVVKVVRIIEMVTITHLPEAPNSIEGIINLHGRAVPVMDLHRRFGLPKPAYGLHTPIVLVDAAQGRNGTLPLGLVVSSVEQVLTVPQADVELTAGVIPTGSGQQLNGEHTPYLAGLAKVDRQMILILDISALLKMDEQVRLHEAMVEVA